MPNKKSRLLQLVKLNQAQDASNPLKYRDPNKRYSITYGDTHQYESDISEMTPRSIVLGEDGTVRIRQPYETLNIPEPSFNDLNLHEEPIKLDITSDPVFMPIHDTQAALPEIPNINAYDSKYNTGIPSAMPNKEFARPDIHPDYAEANRQLFRDAFAGARRDGKSKFKFDGKLYNTDYVEEVIHSTDNVGDIKNITLEGNDLHAKPEEEKRKGSKHIVRREARIIRRQKKYVAKHPNILKKKEDSTTKSATKPTTTPTTKPVAAGSTVKQTVKSDKYGKYSGRKDLSEFEKAFAYARSQGKSEFKFSGKLYNTNVSKKK